MELTNFLEKEDFKFALVAYLMEMDLPIPTDLQSYMLEQGVSMDHIMVFSTLKDHYGIVISFMEEEDDELQSFFEFDDDDMDQIHTLRNQYGPISDKDIN